MNEIILKLLNEFSALQLPINPSLIKKIFEIIPLDDELHSPEYNEHYELLNRLKQLSQDFFVSNSKLDTLNNRQLNFNTLSLQKEEVSRKAKELQIKMGGLNPKLLAAYKTIEAKINDSILAQDPLAISLQHSQYHSMKTVIAQRLEELNTACKDIDARKAKSKLALLINLFNRLITELTTLEVNCSGTTTSSQIQEFKEQIDSEVIILQQHYDKAIVLQNLFAQQLSVEDLALKNAQLEAQEKQLAKAQEAISLTISTFLLDDHIKARLTNEFNSSNDKTALLEEYRGKIDSVWDYVNPLAWASWGLNVLTLNLDKEKHDREQITIKLSVQYLELLNNQFINQAQKNDILANKLLLEKAKPKSGSGNEITIRADMLIAETITLFNDLHSFTSIIELQEDSSEADFYLTLLLNLPLITDKLEKKCSALSKLEDLIPLYNAIEQLRIESGLRLEDDALLPPPKEAQQEINTLEEQAPQRDEFQSQLELCIAYQNDAQEFDSLTMILSEYTATLKQININLRLPANKAPSKGEIDSLKNHLATITETISSKFNQLHHLATLTIVEKPVSEVPVITIKPDVNEKNNELIEEEPSHNQPPILVQNISLNPVIEELALPGKLSLEQTSNLDESYSEAADFEYHLQAETKDASYITNTHLDAAISSALQRLETSEEYFDLSSSKESSEERTESSDSSLDDPRPTPSPFTTALRSSNDLTATATPILIEEPSDSLSEKEQALTILEDSTLNTATTQVSVKMKNTELFIPDPEPIQSISASCSDTSETYTLSDSSNSLSEDNEFGYSTMQTPMQINCDNTIKWQNEIKGYILRREVDIQLWYKEVHDALQQPLTIESSCYKAAHLIRDILFELEHHKHNDVIRAYMRLCPNPAQDIHKLLALKPSLLIIETSVDPDTLLIDSPAQLKKYYLHYNKLKSAYPVEAELFIQAIQSLHMIQLYMELPEHDISTEQVPSLSNDPRYESLKRHRGFLQIWELLEDLCRLIIGKITGQHDYEYVKRPCFFNTKSNQLLQEADTLIEDLLPGNTI